MSCRKGRHRKPSRVKALAAPGVTAAVITGGMVLASSPMASAHAFPDPAPSAPDPELASITALIQHYMPRHAASETLLVKPGDTLGSISARACGTPDDWTGIYKKNKKVIGENPDLILPGQHLVRNCQDVPLPHPRIVVAAAVQSQGRHAAVSSGGYYHSASGGNLSFAGLERLWIAAGGDSWAARSAAAVAECESGGRQYAHNPSGASGYWQILGEVIPGNVYNPMTNAKNAVAKFNASGKSWAQWVCKP